MNLVSGRFKLDFPGFDLMLDWANQPLLHRISTCLKLDEIWECFLCDALESHCIKVDTNNFGLAGCYWCCQGLKTVFLYSVFLSSHWYSLFDVMNDRLPSSLLTLRLASMNKLWLHFFLEFKVRFTLLLRLAILWSKARTVGTCGCARFLNFHSFNLKCFRPTRSRLIWEHYRVLDVFSMRQEINASMSKLTKGHDTWHEKAPPSKREERARLKICSADFCCVHIFKCLRNIFKIESHASKGMPEVPL